MDPLFDKTEPPEPVDTVTEDDKVVVTESLLEPDTTSARKSEDEDEGARVPIDDPTGQGATGISEREDAEGL